MKTVKDYNLPLNSSKDKQQEQQEKISTGLFYQVCADTVEAKQSTGHMGTGYAFFAHQTS